MPQRTDAEGGVPVQLEGVAISAGGSGFGTDCLSSCLVSPRSAC